MNTTLTNFAAGTLTGGTYEVYSGTLSFNNGGYSNDIVTNAANILLGGTSGAPSIIDQNGNNALAQFATNAAAGNFTIQNGVSVTTASSDFTNAGTINLLPGTLIVEGNYTQESTGTLGIGLGGLTAGTQFGQLIINGTATLDGTLNISLINGYAPALGNSYEIMPFGSLTTGSDFTTKNLPTLSGGLVLVPVYNPTNLTLTTVQATQAPTVTGLSPTSGPLAGGTPVTITGTGFTGATAVDFGTTAATSYTVVSSTDDHGHQPGGHRHRGRHRDHSGRHVGHLGRRSVHVHRRSGGHGPEPDQRSDRRRHFGDDHRHRLHRRHGGRLRHDGGDERHGGQQHRRSRPTARRAPAPWTSP